MSDLRRLKRRACIGLALLMGFAGALRARAQSAKQIVQTMILHEQEALSRRGHYAYLSQERSERTGGHLWDERRAETRWGIVTYLVAEDGRPLSGARTASERAKLTEYARSPEEFRREVQKQDEDQHSQQMLALLGKAFLFDTPQSDGDEIRIGYRPDPAFVPGTLEERVLHSMAGTVTVDAKAIRLRELNGRIPQDVSLGFGPLATIHAGSEFSTTREHIEGSDWKTDYVHTDIKGRALFVKTIARQQESKHAGFKRVPDGMTVAEAVALVEQ